MTLRRLTPYVWNRGLATEIPGVEIKNSHGWLFIPESEIVDLSNRLIDFIEEKETR